MSNSERIVVAMSGGVDSSVAALLLAQGGQEVVGISMQVWDYRKNGGCSTRATCCSPDDFTDARRVADKIGVPYYVFDFEKTFRTEVIDKFIKTYQIGKTPNPCVDCNQKVKFKELRERALAFGCSKVATGHYAQIREGAQGLELVRSVDRKKDQSYFLYGMTRAELATTLFPIGHLTKPEVRTIAEKADLVTAAKPESQDICFVAGTAQEFLSKHGGKTPGGWFVDKAGKRLARHDGIYQFTVGQRRGLDLGGNAEPLYVLAIDPDTNNVTVGLRSDLEQASFFVGELNWLIPSGDRFPAMAQLRHGHAGTRVEVEMLEDQKVRCHFVDGWSTVSPGQAAVFYDLKNEAVIGGGRIEFPPQISTCRPSSITRSLGSPKNVEGS